MNQNSNAIITLCSHLCVGDDVIPLEPKEWSELAQKLLNAKLEPMELFNLSPKEIEVQLGVGSDYVNRISRLIERSASLTFELSNYENMGIKVITRADKEYPAKLKKVLGNNSPPIFYYGGNLSILNKNCVGYVGSRTISDADISFAKSTIQKTVAQGFGVVSGGAKGIDGISEEQALSLGAPVVEYLSDSMMRKICTSSVIRSIQEGKLLLLSVVKPDAGFNVGVAMMRNRYIYAQSKGTVVVRSDYNKGGTWAGATENLKHGWCKELCWNKKSYHGNLALIEKGAIPIDEQWDGNIDMIANNIHLKQLSLFD